MSVNKVNVKTIPLTTLEGIASTQAFASNDAAPLMDKDPKHSDTGLPFSQQASQHTSIFNHNAGENFSPVSGSLAVRQHNATLAVNPFAGAAATRGNIVASSNTSIGSMPTPQLSAYFYNRSRTFHDPRQMNDASLPGGGAVVAGPTGTANYTPNTQGAVELAGNYLTAGSTAQIGPAQLDDNVPDGTALLNTGYSYTNPGNENPRELGVQVSNDPPTVDVNLDAPRLNLLSGQDMYTFSMNNTTLAQNFNTTMYYNAFTQTSLTSDGHRGIPGATNSKPPGLF